MKVLLVSRLLPMRNSMKGLTICQPIRYHLIVNKFFGVTVWNFPPTRTKIHSSQLEFFIYPFSEKETVTVPVLPKNKSDTFGFKLRDDELFGRTFVEGVNNTKTSSAAHTFGDFKRSHRKFKGAFITHIDGDPVFSTDDATSKLHFLFKKWKEVQQEAHVQGVVPQFLFNITFAREEQLQGKKLKKAIDDYHFLTPGTTKRVKSKVSSSEEEESDLEDVDNGLKRFPIGFKVYNLFEGVPFKGKVTGYDLNN